MFRSCFIVVLTLLVGCQHKDLSTIAFDVFSEEAVKIEEVSEVVQECRDALVFIRVAVTFEGRFYDMANDEFIKSVTKVSNGNGFAVDAYGNIMTNSHVASPEEKIMKAFKRTEPFDFHNGIKTGYRFDRLDGINLLYTVYDSIGNSYSTQYKVQAEFDYKPGEHVPLRVSVTDMQVEKFSLSGRVKIEAVDDLADLALISIPPKNSFFLSFEDFSSLQNGVELYSLTLSRTSFESSKKYPYVTVRVGPLQEKCIVLSYGNEQDTVAAYVHMYANYGNSGGPIVAASGKVAGVIQAKKEKKGAYAVPADYAYAFYLYASGQSSNKPLQICDCKKGH